MKNQIITMILLVSLPGLMGSKSDSDPATWSNKKIEKWFVNAEWLGGWKVTPDASINKRSFAVSYYKNKERWDRAFIFLRSSDLSKLEVKRYDIDGDNLYATISEYITKNEEDAKFEAHRKYIDIQYLISGTELMGVSPISQKKDILEPYDTAKDIEFMTVTNSNNYKATPDRFFIFFPSDLHRPGVKADENSKVRKVVIKVKVD